MTGGNASIEPSPPSDGGERRSIGPLAIAIYETHGAALEADGRVVFLYAVRPGPADRAEAVLAALAAAPQPAVPPPVAAEQASLGFRVANGAAPTDQLGPDGLATGPTAAERLARAVRELDVAGLTPREAIDWLFEQRARLGGGT